MQEECIVNCGWNTALALLPPYLFFDTAKSVKNLSHILQLKNEMSLVVVVQEFEEVLPEHTDTL